MPKDYKNINKKKREPLSERFSKLLSFFTGLTLGLFIAVIVYFNEHNSTIKTNNVLLDKEPVILQADEEQDKQRVESLSEPEFEFYRILREKKITISEWESVDEETPSEPADEPVMLILQIGSFKQYEAADNIKAKLALMGITADIQRVVINGQDVRYRVRVGPYKNNNDKLQQTKDRLLANDLDFMLLKLKMKDI